MTMEPTDYLAQTTRITKDGIYFGKEKLPGLIAQDGVVLHPGGHDDLNRLTVTFLVGPVEATDPMVEETTIASNYGQQPIATRYSCNANANG